MDGTDPPITATGDVVVIGPLIGQADTHTELVRRTAQWLESPGRSVAAGGGLTTDAAVRRAAGRLRDLSPDTAAIVHPASGQSDYVRLRGAGRMRWTGIRSLADVSAASPGRTIDPADAVTRWTNPWSGLFTPAVTDTPPSGGQVTARLQGAGAAPQTSLGWADDPATAAGRALLAGVRVLAPRYGPAVPPGRILVGAAGASELHWLLDGALQLLSAYGVEAEDRVPVDDGLEVVGYRVPQLADDWRIARVFRTRSEALLAAAWGYGVPAATGHAVAAARAWLATPSAPGLERPTADAMLAGLAVPDLARLHHDVQRCLARLRFRPLGARVAADALLGDPGLAWGMVWQA